MSIYTSQVQYINFNPWSSKGQSITNINVTFLLFLKEKMSINTIIQNNSGIFEKELSPFKIAYKFFGEHLPNNTLIQFSFAIITVS